MQLAIPNTRLRRKVEDCIDLIERNRDRPHVVSKREVWMLHGHPDPLLLDFEVVERVQLIQTNHADTRIEKLSTESVPDKASAPRH